MREDTFALPKATGLHAAVVAELVASGLDPSGFCFSGVVPGAQYALDHLIGDCEGVLWVRVAGYAPIAEPVQTQPTGRAQPPRMEAMYEVGLVRGVELRDDAEPADELTQYEQARLQWADAAALRRAICAYFTSVDWKWDLHPYQPFGPEGGALGGVWGVNARPA